MIYDATINGIGNSFYNDSQKAAYYIFDNGYYATSEQGGYGLRHCDDPGTIISINAPPVNAGGARGRTGWGRGKNFFIVCDSSAAFPPAANPTNDLYRVTTNGSTITWTLVKNNCCISLGSAAWGMLLVSPSGNVIATKSYYSSDTNVNPVYWGESFGLDANTGDQLWHFVWKNIGHANSDLYHIVSDDRVVVRCATHGVTHLINTNDGSVVADWSGYVPGSSVTTIMLGSAYSSVVSENLILGVDDVYADNNHKIIVVAGISTEGDAFTVQWLKYLQTDWMRSYYNNSGYPIAYNWLGDRRAVISTGGYSYSGAHFEQTLYVVDTLTGDISAGESTPWIVDGVSFYSSGQFMSGMCGPDDMYISIISDYEYPESYHHSYKIKDGGTSDKNSLYYRRLLTDGDTLAWADDEYQVPTNWPRGYTMLARSGEFNGRITVTPESPTAHEDDVSPVYWIDPVNNTYAESETKTNAWLTSRGTGLHAVAAGDTTSVVHMEVLDNEEDYWEKIFGCGTLSLWGSGVLEALRNALRLGSRNDGEGKTERHGRINTVRQEWSSDRGNRLQFGQKGTYQ